MKIEHLVSTMFQKNMDFTHHMGCKEDMLVVNQTVTDNFLEELYEGRRHRMLSVTERGLSNSRNRLLENAKGDIVILGDDDLLYLEGYSQKIRKAYEDHPDADIIAFSFTQKQFESTRRQFKTARKLNLFTISKIASVEITFKAKAVLDAKLQFCPVLGLGAKYGACEENAFLADALRAGLTIWYVPETICYLKPDPPERVKWQKGFDQEYFVKRGACFYRIYGKLFGPFSLAFLLLKKRTVFRDISVIKAYRWMCKGRKAFKKDEWEAQKCS